jgi:ribosomal protein S12 methylthiotransferase accessory factor
MANRKALGITRVADITGLDVVGIPVVQVVRPFSLSNSVSQGKGRTMAEAAISAIFESAESCFAERLAYFNPVTATANSLNVPFEHFERHLRGSAPQDWRDRETSWIAAGNLLNGSSSLVPLEFVHTAYVVPSAPHDGIFVASTTGLAASFEEPDAVVHGILECIERDAIARAHVTHGFFQHCRIDPRTIDNPPIRNLLEALNSKGLLVGLWQAPSPVGVPVIWCHLMEDREADTALLSHPAEGSAASTDPATAIAYAIYEAAQSRLAAISGARDDMTRAFYPKYPDWEKIAAHRRLLAEGSQDQNFQAIAGQKTMSAGELLPHLLTMLEARGIEAVYKVRIDTSPINGLAVVKIIIPALQPLLQG